MNYRHIVRLACLGTIFGAVSAASAAPTASEKPTNSEKAVTIHAVDASGQGKTLGTITFSETATGLRLVAKLTGLPPGERGFHIHENPNCDAKEKDGKMVAALAAGGHMDAAKTGKHLGPNGGGHGGDLPKLKVNEDGTANETLEIKGLKVADITNRSIMIHAGGDNYSDAPEPLGGGGARIACGVIR